ncbi:hypothetical protein ACG04Q_03550 [Roseateles sp. DXS20W]|uniref:Uncharacterized protein n=1 Tax=Pelomonas lactea TaxID=3299030 RepID=A0ABW7GFA0_9BURK
MDDFPGDLVFWACVLLGVIALIVAVFKADRGDAESILQKRLAAYPASARAVILRGKQPAGWKLALQIFVMVAIALGMPKLQTPGTLALLCERFGAAQTAQLLWLLIYPGLPFLMLLALSPLLLQSVRVLRGGYAPPLDSVPTQDTIAVAGWRAVLRGMVGLVLFPVLVGVIGYLAADLRQTFNRNPVSADARCPIGEPPPTALHL